MLSVFEVYLEKFSDPDSLLSPEAKEETQAQVMTADEARQLGFQGIKEDPSKGILRLIAVAQRDEGFIKSALERHHGVRGYQIHLIDT